MTTRVDYFPLQGGVDEITPRLSRTPGSLITCKNFEPGPAGYRRSDGYEVFDGRIPVSQHRYWLLNFHNGELEPSAGDVIQGHSGVNVRFTVTSVTLSSGAWGSNTAAGYLILRKGFVPSGSTIAADIYDNWVEDDQLDTWPGGTKIADAIGYPQEHGLTDADADAAATAAAIESARDEVLAVGMASVNTPGTNVPSGAVRGVHVHSNGCCYAFRDVTVSPSPAAGALFYTKNDTATDPYGGGWFRGNLGYVVSFNTGGTYEIKVGDTITDATTSGTGTVLRLVLTDDDWAGTKSAGRIYYSKGSGSIGSGNPLNVGAHTNVAITTTTGTAVALAAGGRYECTSTNMFGATNNPRMFFLGGVGPAYELVTDAYGVPKAAVSIETGMTSNIPTHIAVHKNHLFLSFAGGSVQHSAIGDPHSWSPLLGASELGIGEDVTGMVSTLDYLIIFGKNSIWFLSGTSSADWVLKPFTLQSGAVANSIQNLIQPVFYDGVAIRTLQASQNYGNMDFAAASQRIEKTLHRINKLGSAVMVSFLSRVKNQYRICFDSGVCLVVYNPDTKPEWGFLEYSPVFSCATQAEDRFGRQVILAGAEDGYVYQLDSGNSANDVALNCFLRTSYYTAKTPENIKRWHKVGVEIQAEATSSLRMWATFDYGVGSVPDSDNTFPVYGGGATMDESYFDEAYFDASSDSGLSGRINGRGKTIGLLFSVDSQYEDPLTLTGITVSYSLRRQER